MVTLLLLGCAPSSKDTAPPVESAESAVDTEPDSDTPSDSDTGETETGDTETLPLDADGDGYAADVDCDDADAARYPGAAETAYDGIDQDCDGSDLVDVDGDGHPATTAGGDDCDDTNLYVYPGAEEWCDPVDHDCDGDPLAPGVCAKVQDLHATAAWIPDFEAALHSVADLTGDGQPDMIIGGGEGIFPNPYGSLSGGVSLFEGGSVPGLLPAGVAGAAAHSWSLDTHACSIASPPFDAGDVDGDGADDLGIDISWCNWGIYIERGPFAVDGGAEWISDADYRWVTDFDYSYGTWAEEIVAGSDFNDDGLADLALSLTDTDGLWQYHVFFGGNWDEHSGIEATYDHGSGEHMWTFDDLDGDGIPELGIGDFSIVSGADLAGADGADLHDLAYADMGWNDEMEKKYGAFQDGWITPGDWTGDGRSDLVAADLSAHTGGIGEVMWFDGGTTGEFWPEDALGGVAGVSEPDLPLAYNLARGDFDGDGAWDVLGIGGDFVAVIPAARGIPAPHTPVDEAAALLIGGGTIFNHDRLDTNGDAYADLMFYPHDETLGFVFGWDVPWDDPQYW